MPDRRTWPSRSAASCSPVGDPSNLITTICNDQIYRQPHQILRQRGQTTVVAGGESVLDREVPAFNVSQFQQRIAEGVEDPSDRVLGGGQYANPEHRACRLRTAAE